MSTKKTFPTTNIPLLLLQKSEQKLIKLVSDFSRNYTTKVAVAKFVKFFRQKSWTHSINPLEERPLRHLKHSGGMKQFVLRNHPATILENASAFPRFLDLVTGKNDREKINILLNLI